MEKSPNLETDDNNNYGTRVNNDLNQVGNKERAGNLLDDNHFLTTVDKYNIIGAASGVKPVTEFQIDIPSSQQESICGEIDSILDDLELKYTKITENYPEDIDDSENLKDADDSKYALVQYFASKSEEDMLLVKGLVYGWLDPEERIKLDLSSPRYSPIFSFASQLERHFVKTYGSDCSGKIQKQAILGKLFGYPESAIKHYFVRIYSDEVFYPDTTGHDLLYIHNPECRESEHEQYENHINPFFKQLCPKNNEEFPESAPKNN